MSFKKRQHSRRQIFKIYICLSFLICFGWLLLGQNNKALAAWDTTTTISNTAPLPNSANVYKDKNQTPANFVKSATPSFVVGDGIFDGNYAWMKFYIPIGQPATVTIQNGGGFCSRSTPVNDEMDSNFKTSTTSENPHVLYSLYELDSGENEYSSTPSYFKGLDSTTGGAACTDLSFPVIPANAGVASAVYGHTGYRVFAFLAHIVNCPDNTSAQPDNTKCVHDIVKEFRLSTTAGLVGTSRAINAKTNAGSPFGVVYDVAPLNYTWNYTFQFAPRCDERVPNSKMFVYDMDGNVQDTQTPSADMYNDDKTVPGISWNLQNHWTEQAPTWQLGQPIDHSIAQLNYASDPNNRIRFDFIDIGEWNRIEDYTGYDQYDASDFVCYAATCVVNSLDPVSGTAETGKDVQVKITTTNLGVAPWQDKFYLGDLTGQDTEKHYVSPSPVAQGGSTTFTFVVSEDTAGTYNLIYQMHEDNDNPFGAKCAVKLTFVQGNGPIVVGCDETRVSGTRSSAAGNVQARLSFTRTSGSDGPATFNYDWSFPNDGGNYNFDTYNSINQLLPHQAYSADFLVLNSNGVYQRRASINLSQCIAVSCFGSIGGADVEPGQSTQISYGVTVVNDTTEGFNGYNLHLINADGGITGVPAAPIPAVLDAGTPGRSTDVQSTFNATINWQGHLQADFYYNNTNLAGLYSSLPCIDKATPKTRPFLKVTQGDVSTGGSFAQYDDTTKTSACPNVGSSAYVSPTSANLYPGGIRTFSTPTSLKGSSADFAAYALGLIDGDEDGPDGFYSSNINGGGENNVNTLSFANKGTNNVGALGGLLGGDTPSQTAHCMPDLFNATRDPSLTATTTNNIDISSLGTGQYYYTNAGIINLGGGGTNVINPGNRITIYVKGNVFINGDIKYSGSWTPNRIPYFALIVEGNITIDPSVTNLDGLYVAQPTVDSSGNPSQGIFVTCSVDGSPNVSATQITNNCNNNELTINGAVMARRVTPDRSFSTMWNGSQAETFNFTPSMVLSTPDFYTTTGAVIPYTLTNLQSLPPVF